MANLPGIILAGGLSKRMGGGDKGLLTLDNKTIIGRVIDKILPQVSNLAININGDPSRFSKFPYPLISDSIDGFAGPLAGVLAGMDWAFQNGSDFIATVAADSPFFPDDLVEKLFSPTQNKNSDITIASAQNPNTGKVIRHPTFGLWSVKLREDLREELFNGSRKIITWAERHKLDYVKFKIEDTRKDPFFNINTPQDLDDAKERLSGGCR